LASLDETAHPLLRYSLVIYVTESTRNEFHLRIPIAGQSPWLS
jgi:hypothetical protein